MYYIELEENIEKRKKFFRIFSKRNKIIEEKNEDKILLKVPNIENKTLNNLSKYIRKNCISSMCLSDNLINNNIFLNYIENEGIKIINGKWLFKILATNIIDYIIENKKETYEQQEISILSNKFDEIIDYTIRKLSDKVKSINIITNNYYRFKKIEKDLYEEKGIILNLNNNYKKSLLKSDIILNFDFNEEDLNKYSLQKKACIINFSNEASVNLKSFEGIIINFYEISMPKKYFKYFLKLDRFNVSILYESFIYKNTNIRNILDEISKDGVKITFLIGKNGRIRKNEYLKMSKKLVN